MKIKEIKIVNQDQSTEIADIGADAINVDYNDTTVKAELDKWNSDNNPLALKLNKKPYYYDNVTAMKADTTLKAGDMAITLGYYEANDGGGAEYKIVSTTSSYAETLNNNLKAELIIGNCIYVKQFGFQNNTDVMTKMSSIGNLLENFSKIKKVVFTKEIYNLTGNVSWLIASNDFEIDFAGAEIRLINTFKGDLIKIQMNKNEKTSLKVHNGNFNGLYGNQPDFSASAINPNGCHVLKIEEAREVIAENLFFNDWFYSDCLNVSYVDNAFINNCHGYNIGGRSADNTVDASGDALYFGYVGVVTDNNGTLDTTLSHEVNITVQNCTFKSYAAVENTNPSNTRNGSHSGRAGIVLGEFSMTGKHKNFTISNCYFYNYQRTMHLELGDNIDLCIENTVFEEYGAGVLFGATAINNIEFINCNFIKNFDIVPIEPEYGFFFCGALTNKVKKITFNNCNFYNLAGKLGLYGKNIDVLYTNCYFEVNHLYFSSDCHMKFNYCKIKANKWQVYKSIYSIHNSEVTLGYLNDENSLYYIFANDVTNYFNSNEEAVIDNNMLINFGIQYMVHSNYIIRNNNFRYDENFKNIGYTGATVNSYITPYNKRLREFSNNKIYNYISSSVIWFIGDTSVERMAVKNNKFFNIGLRIYNSNTFETVISDNLFFNENENVTKGIDLYGTKALVYNNILKGYTQPMRDYSNSVQYNNYNNVDNVLTLIS